MTKLYRNSKGIGKKSQDLNQLSPAVGDWKPSAAVLSGSGARNAGTGVLAPPVCGGGPLEPLPESGKGFPGGAGEKPPPGRVAARSLPGYTNSRVVSATETRGLDWLSLTLPAGYKNQNELQEKAVLRLGSTAEIRYGGHGYEGVDLAVHGRLVWRDTRRGRDYLMVLPAQALEYIREEMNQEIPVLLKGFLDDGWRCSRLDAAHDTTRLDVNPQMVLDAWRAGTVVCEAEDAAEHQSKIKKGQAAKGDGAAMTTEVGNRQSSRFLRVYDKRAQLFEVTGQTIAHTTRFELEHKGEAAQKAALFIAEHGEDFIPLLFRGWIDFKTARGREEIYKRKSAHWWQSIMHTGKKKQLGLKRGLATPEKTMKWEAAQWAAALKLTMEYAPEHLRRVASRANISANLRSRWEAKFRPGQQRRIEAMHE